MIRLVVEVDASNVGLRELQINPAESGLRVYTLSARPEAVEEAAEARWGDRWPERLQALRGREGVE